MKCLPTPDRRSSLRDQRHVAIVEAARTLATQHGADGFTIDRVASLAGVSRRTVFNHFATMDVLLVAVCEQVLDEVTSRLLIRVEELTEHLPAGSEGGSAALDAIGEAARGVDLPAAIVTIHHVLGGPSVAYGERAAAISRTAFEQVGDRLRGRLLDRAPDLDPLDLELALTLLTNGLALIAAHWLCRQPNLTTDLPTRARADWDDLLDRLLHRLRFGHAGSIPPNERLVSRHG